MKRRDFLTAILAAGAVGAIPAAAKTTDSRYFYEWIHMTALNNATAGDIEKYWATAAIPALNRLGIEPVGLFRAKYGPSSIDFYALIPHPTLESFLTTWDKVATDTAYQTDGADFINRDMSKALYNRFQTSLLHAFEKMPALEVPEAIKNKNGRIFEVRTYESHSRDKAKRKIDMFNNGGEIAVFKETGLNPIMFGETLAGEKMPNLMYMLGFANMQARDDAWGVFGGSEGWKNIKDLPQYADTVCAITDVILSPCRCSQI